MRQSIVTYGGHDASGDLFNIRYSYPDPPLGGVSPSVAQRAAVSGFYGFDLEGLDTEDTAHLLLSIRDYAKLVAAAVFPRLDTTRRITVARFLAAFLCSGAERCSDVQRWSDDRWRRGADPDRVMVGLSRTKHFAAAEAFAHAAVADMREAGAKGL